MKPIQMVDLKAQYAQIQAEVEREVLDCLSSTAYINGPQVKSFQAELESYLGVPHVIPCANGTDALQVAMMALGFQPGDEAIVPTFTYISTAEVIALLGLTPVMVDVDPDTFNVTAELIEAAITEKTKAIVPVHLFGQCADMEPILALAKKHKLYVIEDAAQAIGARYTFSDGSTKAAGCIGDIGGTSFYPSKNLGAYGDGGALFTESDELAQRLRMVANHGQTRRYYHDAVGVNSRLDSIQAAILRIKLRRLDEYSAARRKAADYYDAAFADIKAIQTPVRAHNSTHVFHQYTLKVPADKRDALKEHLQEQGIPSMIYYPVPLNKQEAFKDSVQENNTGFPFTEELCQRVISLPMHTELTEDQLEKIVTEVKNFLQ